MTDGVVARLARGRMYYGWYIVGVVLAAGIPRVGLNGSFFGIFLKPMSEEFDWTRAETNLAVTIGTLIAAGSGILLGRALDRFGPRVMMAGGFALLAGSYFGLAWTTSSLILFYVVFSVGRSIMQGATGHAMMYALVSKWFVRRRAKAISVATMGGYLGGIFLAPATQSIIDNVSWRLAWTFFGGLTIAMALIPALILLRRVPEDIGLLPDGDQAVDPSDHPDSPQSSATAEVSLTLHDALRTPAFWLLTTMLTVNSLAMTGITFHMVPHFTDVGISTTAAAATISFLTFGSMGTVFAWGYLGDRLGAKRVLIAVFAVLLGGSYLVSISTDANAAFISSAIFGTGMAGYILLSEVVWASFFGRRYLGSIRGVTMVFQLAGNASGSLIAALLFDIQGSYDGAFQVIIGGFAVSLTLLLLARKPKAKVVGAA